MNAQGIDQLLSQLRSMAAQAAGEAKPEGPAGGDFAALLKTTLDQVNQAQREAKALTRQFEEGAPGVDLHDVMISLQKANLSFQTMVQVRNKLVSAYQEIINMQV
jgi:flagellar hook-basal body complex protein FliE